MLNLENLHDISSELSSQGQILSQVVRDIQLHHKELISLIALNNYLGFIGNF